MKRSAPKRKTPLKRGDSQLKRTPLKQSTSGLARSPLKSRSDERAKFMKDVRAPLVASLIEMGTTCKVCPVLSSAGIPTHCQSDISGLHERRKRSSGGSLVNMRNLIPACSWGNEFIEIEPKLVRDLTGDALVVRSHDPEWNDLGAKNDP